MYLTVNCKALIQKDRILCANNAPDSKNRYMPCVWYLGMSWDPCWDMVLSGRMGDSRETTTFEREENWKFGSCNLKHQSTLTSTAIETFDIH